MHIVFLGARLPLTKTFVFNNGQIAAAPYPHVSRVTSFHEEANTLNDFELLLRKHADLGRCLFNGQLESPLVNESRAGKTKTTPRTWVVFDFDRVAASSAADAIATYLPPECQNVSYVSQVSASMFRPDTTQWSGHIFMLLKEPVDAQRVKQWFEYLNFSQPALEKSITLSDSLQALHWPLDRTVAYNSKLIYIAPPKCHGFEPVVKDAIKLVKKKNSHLTIPTFTPLDSMAVRAKINELRAKVGEDPIDYSTTIFEGKEMLLKSGICEVHGVRTSGDHYIRFNLNSGDSLAYFIDLRNPAIIRNFKGEPLLKTAEAAPDLYKALRAKAPGIVTKQPLEEGTEVLAFYATNQSSSVRVGSFNPIERKLTLNNATETSAKAWLAEYGLVQKGYLPHMDLVFNPQNTVQYVPGSTSINTFRASNYMVTKPSSATPSSLRDIPPLTFKLLQSILGNPNQEMLHAFVNWFAYIFHYRDKTATAWVLHGVPGSGKGLFVKYIMTPLFGPEHVRVVQFPALQLQFNAFLETALFVVIEEADMRAVNNEADLEARMEHYIADSPIEINSKGIKPYQAPNFSNFLLFSNKNAIVNIKAGDRRYNVANKQTERFYPTPNELNMLTAGAELDAFADVLQRWPVDTVAAHMVIKSEAKDDIHEATTSINQLIAEAILRGDLQFFIDRMPSEAEAASDFFNKFNPLGMFKEKMAIYSDAAARGVAVCLKDADLFALFRTMIPDTRFFQDNKTWRIRHFKQLGLDTSKQVFIDGRKDRGIKITWQKPTTPMDKPEHHTDNVIAMAKGKKK